jgi:hypothetical protein
MDRFNALGRGMQIMLVAGVLLFLDTFLDWQSVDLGPIGDVGVSAWDDIGGILLAVLTLALVVWIAIRLAGVDFRLPVSDTLISAVLALLILVLAVVKNLEDDFSTIWAWIGMFLAIAIAIGAWMQVQAAGGMDTLKAEMPRGSGTGTAGTTPTTTSTAPPPASTAPVPPAGPAEPYPAPERQAPEAAPEEYEPPEEPIERDERDEPDRI